MTKEYKHKRYDKKVEHVTAEMKIHLVNHNSLHERGGKV